MKRGRPGFHFLGRGLDDAPISVVCRLLEGRVVALSAIRVPEPPFRD